MISVSPAFLLALVLAAASATLYALIARTSWLLLPVCWGLGILAFVAGQAVGAVLGWSLLLVGQLNAGLGIVLNALALLGFHRGLMWYNGRHE
ncbi:MAG: hypothetical protein NVSMB65_14030 [Chloroflexota bacterium]